MTSPAPFRLPVRAAGMATVAVAVITIAGCTTTGTGIDTAGLPSGWRQVPAADRPPASFLTVTAGMYKIARVTPSSEWIARYPVHALQLRSLRHGRLIKTLLRSLGGIEAASASDGMVIAAVDFGCRSQLFRIDPVAGDRTLIRVVPRSVEDIALSPDGSRLAYITDPPSQRQRCQRMRQPRHPVKAFVNPPGILPRTPTYQMLAILSLASGATVRTEIRHGADPTWSPDGAKIAVTDTWANVTHVLSATTLKALAVHKFLPCRFGYTASDWTRSGLAVALACDIEHGRGRPVLELTPLTGPGHASRFALPRCTAAVTASFAAGNALIWAGLGYGARKPCGFGKAGGYAVAVMLLRGYRFGAVATIPQQAGDFTFAGW